MHENHSHKLNGAPTGAQVLLWLGSTIAICVLSTWVLVNQAVEHHAHDDYVRIRELAGMTEVMAKVQTRIDELEKDLNFLRYGTQKRNYVNEEPTSYKFPADF